MRKIVGVEPVDDYKLILEFDNGEKKIKDMKPYLEKGVFSKLKDEEFFKKVKISFGTISWDNDIDLCADSLYESSTNIEQSK